MNQKEEFDELVMTLVEAALARPQGERDQYIRSVCQSNPELYDEVQHRVAMEERMGAFLREPLVERKTADDSPFETGMMVAGRFLIIREVGRGGMGMVYEARDKKLERRVAIKCAQPAFRNRLSPETRLAGEVSHYNVCKVYDLHVAESRLGTVDFITMEFVEGETLAHRLARSGALPEPEAREIALQVSSGLAEAHRQGVIHSDLKPGNIILARSSEGGMRAVITDFGLAKPELLPSGSSVMSGAGGTPEYMAPELFHGVRSSIASDLYALGVLLHEMLKGHAPPLVESQSGTMPVSAAQATTVVASGEAQPPPAMLRNIEQLPSPWMKVVTRCLSANPHERPKSADEIFRALSPQSALRKWLGAAVVLLVAAIVSLAAISPGFRNLLIRPGIAAGQHQDYLKAKDLLDQAYRPNNVESAIELLEKLTQADPNFALAHAGLGRAYWVQYRGRNNSADLEKATAACVKALELDRDLAPAHVILGQIYTQTGRNDLASEELSQALRLDSRNADAWGAWAELCEKLGRTSEVEPSLQKAIDLAPTDWRWPNGLGLYYARVGKFDAAIRQIQQAVQLTPDNPQAYNNLGNTYLRQERFTDARSAYEKSLQIERRPRTLYNLGNVLVLEGRLEEAGKLLQESVQLSPNNYLAWGNLGSAYAWSANGKEDAAKAYLKAISLAEKSRAERPRDPVLLANLGAYYAAVNDAARSTPLLRQAAALAPDNPEVLYRVGEGYELLGQRAEALRWIAKAVDLGYSLEYIKRSPELAALRSDPKFLAGSKRKLR